MTLDSKLIGNIVEIGLPKTLQQTYMGIDVWGRGSHGGGGFGVFRALEHISPDSLGLSVALFGQAWTWESEQDKDGWSWDKWWEYDSKLWVGSSSGTLGVPLPVLKMKRDESPCTHGDFVPIKSFFSCHAPPDPADLRFHTTFCPGTGLNWFVEGNKVYDSVDGWTDIDKQTSVGDMLWPRPELFWEDERVDRISTALTTFCMDDAWNGGNSLRISISSPGSEEETAAYRSLWLPVQSLSVTPGKLYQASVIYKLDPLADGLDIEVALSPHAAPGAKEDLIINTISSTTQDLAHGWTTLVIQFSISANGNNDSSPLSTACIGIAIAILSETPTESLQLSFLLGQLNISAFVPPAFKEDKALILWADYKPSSNPSSETLSGTLSWEVASTFPLTTSIKIPSLEDPISVWNPQPIGWFPSFLYFNIYAQPFVDPYNAGKVDDAVWIGTSGAGWDGRKKAFTVLQVNLPFKISEKTRFYVQGVTDYGEVMKWERCAFVDVSL
jgi:mannosyl-glycoprotein endo-beta-N-acetylglucosaminidase